MDGHCSAEDTEEDVNFPLDVLECGGDEVSECKVEDPVGSGAKSDGAATDTEREQLRWVGPRDRTPGAGVRGDEQV